MKSKEDILWQIGNPKINIDGRNIYVPDEPNYSISRLLEFVIEPDLIDKIDELFAPDGLGYPFGGEDEFYEDEDMFMAVRITEDKLHYLEWKDENPFDLDKEEIWLVQSSADEQVVLKGDDLRDLLHEARKLWLDNYDSYLAELRTWVWQREEENNVFIDKDGFHVVNDEEGALKNFLLTFGDPKDKEKVDAMFAPDGEGYSNPISHIHRHTYAEGLPNMAWKDDNPWDLEKDEIWTISYEFDGGEETIKGEDLRYLIEETRALWSQWQKKVWMMSPWRKEKSILKLLPKILRKVKSY